MFLFFYLEIIITLIILTSLINLNCFDVNRVMTTQLCSMLKLNLQTRFMNRKTECEVPHVKMPPPPSFVVLRTLKIVLTFFD